MKHLITILLAGLALGGAAAPALANQSLCPQGTGAFNASPTAVATGVAPLACALALPKKNR